MCMTQKHIRAGDLYEIVELYGHRFEIRYGYYEEYERDHSEPIPIYPLFKENPAYTKDGYPLATQMQEPCKEYKLRDKDVDNDRCADCIHFHSKNDNIIGICKCEENKNEEEVK